MDMRSENNKRAGILLREATGSRGKIENRKAKSEKRKAKSEKRKAKSEKRKAKSEKRKAIADSLLRSEGERGSE
jgi:hypothetical protein